MCVCVCAQVGTVHVYLTIYSVCSCVLSVWIGITMIQWLANLNASNKVQSSNLGNSKNCLVDLAPVNNQVDFNQSKYFYGATIMMA